MLEKPNADLSIFTYCVLSVNAALVIEAGRFNPLVILLHCLFLIT